MLWNRTITAQNVCFLWETELTHLTMTEGETLTWTWTHSWRAQDRGVGTPPEEWSTCVGPAWERGGSSENRIVNALDA